MGGSLEEPSDELADRPALPLDDVPDRFALEVDDVADSFRKAPRTSFKIAEIMSFPLAAAYKVDCEIISDKNIMVISMRV